MKNISGVAVVFLGLLAIPKTITEEFHSQNLSNQGSNNNTEYASFLRPQPSQIAYWDVSPTVRVCPSSRITTSRIETAMSFWRSLGYTFDGLVMSNDSSNACTDNIHYFGEIIITLPDQNFDMSQMLGTTRTTYNSSTSIITRSNIQIMTSWVNTERILEHELGHALGWLDYNSTGHIMNHNWTLGGTRVDGLELTITR